MEIREWYPPARPRFDQIQSLLKRGWLISSGMLWRPKDSNILTDPLEITNAISTGDKSYHFAMTHFRIIKPCESLTKESACK